VELDPRWYETFFAADYLRIARATVEAGTDAEVDFVVTALGLEPGARVLDLACGHGRHTVRLAARGFAATGFDRSAESLALARAAGPQVEFVEGDMRELPFEDASFDAVINLFTAFGYFPDEDDDARVLAEVARVLRPGGVFLIDLLNPPGFFRRYRERQWERLDDDVLFLQEYRYDVLTGRSQADWLLVFPDGVRRELRSDLRNYTGPELVRLLRRAGLEQDGAWGDFDGRELTRESIRLIVRARKSAQS
jgi:SAM-dependent methyltransferase